jgi:hypothetical protein
LSEKAHPDRLHTLQDGDSEDDGEGELTLSAGDDSGEQDGGCCGPDAVLRAMQGACVM